MKYYKVWSDSLSGHVFTEDAYNVLTANLEKNNAEHHEVQVLSSVEVLATDKVYDVDDLAELGYSDNTEQNDEKFVDTLIDGFDESDDEGWF